MPDKPILFSGPMVRALIDGRKTQTRRVMKPQPEYRGGYGDESDPDDWGWADEFGDHVSVLDIAPPYAPGDRFWVRETHKQMPRTFAGAPELPEVMYADEDEHDLCERLGWRVVPSIHMPRWASRLTLTVTGVWAERVQDISEADAEAEGAAHCPVCRDTGWVNSGPDGGHECMADGCGDPYVVHFQRLWDSLNAKRGFGWDANPWVWAIKSTVEKRNIDA